MIRILGFALQVVVVAGLAVWLANEPGNVSIEWRDLRADMPLGIFVAGFLVALAASALAYQVWRWVRAMPAEMIARRRARLREQGFKALTQGMVAVAVGEAAEAQRQARRADEMLDEPLLTLLLNAQAAQVSGDDAAAATHYEAMLDQAETAFLGLRGLLDLALAREDWVAAQSFSRRARDLRPDIASINTTLIELDARAGRWDEALVALAQARDKRAFAADEASHLRAALLIERDRSPEAARLSADARLKAAAEAFDSAPSLAPAALLYAQALAHANRRSKAERTLEKSWKAAPHPDVARAHADLGGDDAAGRLARMRHLAEAHPDHLESRLAVAEAALAARDWDEARRQLAAIARPTARSAGLMATLEEAGFGHQLNARQWLRRAAFAGDFAWSCGECGVMHEGWHAACSGCGRLGAIAWREQKPRGPIAEAVATAVGRTRARWEASAGYAAERAARASGASEDVG